MTLVVGWVGGMGGKVDLLWVSMSLAVHVCRVWSDVEVGYRRDMVVGFRRVVVGVRWIACLEKRWRWRWRVGWWMARSWGVGDGVVVFLFPIFDDIYDSNYKGPRHDFVVIQRGGTVVRLHPRKSYDAEPIFLVWQKTSCRANAATYHNLRSAHYPTILLSHE